MNETQTDPRRPVEQAVTFLDKLTEGGIPRDFSVRLWDGTQLPPGPGRPSQFTLVLHHPGSLREMFWPFNKAALGEAFIHGHFDIEGNTLAFFRFLHCVWDQDLATGKKVYLLMHLLAMPKSAPSPTPDQAADLSGAAHTAERDRQAIEYHYDAPPAEFFQLFLDRRMQYSCAYFHEAGEDLDSAQQGKLDHICRKLRLKPGEKLIDFGCGWGGLITHAAENYGVHATGVSNSREQTRCAEALVRDKGLEAQCRVLYCDYREVPETEPFDKAVSVGFAEHLGEKLTPTFFGKVFSILRPGGTYLHHAIAFRPHTPQPIWKEFALKYVFPDGELLPIPETLSHLAAAGFEVRDVESLREHYMYTLRNWLTRLESNHACARELVDDITYRVFRIYFAGAAEGFRSSLYNLYQTVAVKSGGDVSGLPLTRDDWYPHSGSE